MSRRNVKMLVLDLILCDRFNLKILNLVQPSVGVHVNNLIKVVDALIKGGHLPGDAKMEWLYFDLRLNNWAVLISSEMFRELALDEMAPLMEFE